MPRSRQHDASVEVSTLKPRPDMRPTDYPIKLFKDQKSWESWLARRWDKAQGLWLRIAKKASGLKSVNYAEALESALCHGWIDGQRLAHDHRTFLQKFTPRRARSIWSRINIAKTKVLIAAGRMREGGHAAIAAAKADGRWKAAYQAQRVARVPRDLGQALAKNPAAKAFFATLSGQNRFAIIFRITTVKKSETRAKRIIEFVAMLERGETIYPQRKAR